MGGEQGPGIAPENPFVSRRASNRIPDRGWFGKINLQDSFYEHDKARNEVVAIGHKAENPRWQEDFAILFRYPVIAVIDGQLSFTEHEVVGNSVAFFGD